MAWRVLLTNHELDHRFGTQLYVRDVALGLARRGHTAVVFSPRLGDVAAELRDAGLAVVDDLERVGPPPDVIHGHHLLETAAAVTRFPGVPAIFICHGWLPWQEEPPRLPRVRRYLAVDARRRERVATALGIPPSEVEILPNFVDLARLPPRAPLPPTPRRALVFSNQSSAPGFLPAVRTACRHCGIGDLEVVGLAAGNCAADPGALLAGFDLVFARGRAALEAMAVGAAVVLCDAEGDGPLVTPANVAALRDLNFGFQALVEPHSARRLAAEIRRFDRTAAGAVQGWVREHCRIESTLDRLETIYEELVEDAETGTRLADPIADARAVAQLLLSLSARLDDHDALTHRARALAEEVALLHRTSALRARAWVLRSPRLRSVIGLLSRGLRPRRAAT